MNLEYLQYCFSKLTDQEFAVYFAVKLLGACQTTGAEIGAIIGKRPEPIWCHLRKLEKKGFIICDSKNGEGLIILWVRHSAEEKQPDPYQIKYRHLGYKLLSPEGEKKVLMPGNIRKFCEQYGLNRRCFYDVIHAKRKSHKGWRLA